MANTNQRPTSLEQMTNASTPRRRARLYQEHVEDTAPSGEELSTATSSRLQMPRRSSRIRPETPPHSIDRYPHSYGVARRAEQPTGPRDSSYQTTGSPSRRRGSRRPLQTRGRRRGGSSSGIGWSPPRAWTEWRRGSSSSDTGEHDDAAVSSTFDSSNAGSSEQSRITRWSSAMVPRPSSQRNSGPDVSMAFDDYEEEHPAEPRSHSSLMTSRLSRTRHSTDDPILNVMRPATAAVKRPRDKSENTEGRDVLAILNNKKPVSVLFYHSEVPDSRANDIWPNFRSAAKLPARYHVLRQDSRLTSEGRTAKNNLRLLRELLLPGHILKKLRQSDEEDLLEDDLSGTSPGWPAGQLATELYEEIASYLNRDDIKSMRLVCREFDRHVSQVLFKTVVVPFNTEIYGMLGQKKPDLKGKKKVRIENKTLPWKNATGDDVYNGHGLDVFRGFGRHITKFGMSFEVNEDSLAKPPQKSLMECHTSFWGSYNWPFEEYRRFDTVAGLESAADETPRMTVAFSELSKVRELALSIDSGLGWLNGPDRSVRSRILQRPPDVFGTLKKIPDRRAQAQRELWGHIESRHQAVKSDVKLATLYKLETSRALTDLQGAPSLIKEQPGMPFIDPHVIHEAVPHDTADVQLPTSFDDPEVLDCFVVTPPASLTGILFTSAVTPSDAGQLVSPIIPANLTKAQKEWLLETEWAQRAFLASYMLSIIDNPRTFSQIHTLNVSQLSDRYLTMLHRKDFWDALPGLKIVTLQVIPDWRTVLKDEAGFVQTPKVSPSSGIDPFYDLLRQMIGHRHNIKQLTFGWASGGEHAEGLHARNKLLLPPPLLPADKATEQSADLIDEVLLEFPHVEELTLRNCWVSPPVLLQLVKRHDKFKLKHLTVDSVSLTAMLRNPGNGAQLNHAQQAGGLAMAAGAVAALAAAQGVPVAQATVPGQQAQQHTVNPQQVIQLQTLGIQMQVQQVHTQGGGHGPHHLAQPQNQQHQHHQPLIGNPLAAGGLPAFNLTIPNPQAALQAQPREGSWLNMLDIISPGVNLSNFSSGFSQADADRQTSLESIHFVSCGYAKLPYAHFDQTAIEPLHPACKNALFTTRSNALAPAMLSAKWPLLGEIVQEVDPTELTALNAGWDLETGWQDGEEALGAEFDGLLPGGSGRFTGVVRKHTFSVDDTE